MNFFRALCLAGVVALALPFGVGCRTVASSEETACVKPVTVVAKYAPGLVVDAQQSDARWAETPVYELERFTPGGGRGPLTEKAMLAEANPLKVTARVLYDDENLYVGCKVVNDDIMALRDQDQYPHFMAGDTFELFLKPVETNTYFELYTTPAAHRTTYVFPSRSFTGFGLEGLELQPFRSDVKAVAAVDGTLNDHSDKDRGWQAVLIVPRAFLARESGVPMDKDHTWTINLAGYFYSCYRSYNDFTAFPKPPTLDFHAYEYWARLQLAE